jgi:uncharacterized membrane protein YgcG
VAAASAHAVAKAGAQKASKLSESLTAPVPTTAAQARTDPRAAPIAAMASFGGMMLGYIAHGLTMSIKESEFDNLPATAYYLASSQFWLAHGSRVGVIMPMVVPVAFAYVIATPQKSLGAHPKYMLGASVTLRARFRYALRLQGLGNLVACVGMKLFADEWHMFNTALPIHRTNGIWIIVCMCASLMFTFGLFCVQLSVQERAPRWLLAVPLIQCAWNLMHDWEWMLGFYTGPEEDMAGYGLLHALLGLPLTLYQMNHYVYAEATPPPEADMAGWDSKENTPKGSSKSSKDDKDSGGGGRSGAGGSAAAGAAAGAAAASGKDGSGSFSKSSSKLSTCGSAGPASAPSPRPRAR